MNITQFFVIALWTEVFTTKISRLRGSVSNALDLRSKGPWFNPGWGQCQKKFCVGGFSNMVFWNPWASSLKVWIVFFIGLNFLFKSILAWCGMLGHHCGQNDGFFYHTYLRNLYRTIDFLIFWLQNHKYKWFLWLKSIKWTLRMISKILKQSPGGAIYKKNQNKSLKPS